MVVWGIAIQIVNPRLGLDPPRPGIFVSIISKKAFGSVFRIDRARNRACLGMDATGGDGMTSHK